MYKIYLVDDPLERKKLLKKKFLRPSLIIGSILITLSVINEFPLTLNSTSFSWITWSLGIDCLVLPTLLIIEEFELLKTKKSYRYFFYFSYYSFTLYLAHNILYFLFLDQLSLFSFFIIITFVDILLGFLLKFIHKKYNKTLSIKIQIGLMANSIVNRIENRKKK